MTGRYDICECGARKRDVAKRCKKCSGLAMRKEGTSYTRTGQDVCECGALKSKRSKKCKACQHQLPEYREELKWLGLDLDQTLALGVWSPTNPSDAIGKPIKENVAKAKIAKAQGYKLHIYTARPSYQYELIERWLDKHRIPYDGIHTGKMLFKTLVDDRSTHPNSPDWTQPSDPEVAWAAGFFDGEGSIFVTHNKIQGGTMPHKKYTSTSPSMSVAQVDLRPLERFVTALKLPQKVSGPHKPRNSNSQPYYRWATTGRPSVLGVLRQLWPYLSEPKREQAYRVWDELYAVLTPKSPRLQPLPDWEPPEE